MLPISWVIQDNRFLFTLPCRSYSSGQKCIIGKNVQIFFFLVIGIFVVGRTSASGHKLLARPEKTGAEIKKLSHLPAKIFQISRSTPPLLHPSTKNDVFLITLYAATY
ncbi:hypothetical protein [Escherichia coli]|uniref:hypothetical protein n=1 Tax=Escherichia coli TaxID=562 RepID=UPI0018F868E1|nr:hypothetical protein [Escherichia coli]